MTIAATVSGLSTTINATSKNSAAQQNTLDYNSFLKLLLQQMKSQDPSQPVDQTQMLAQLASFSNVAQTTKINDQLTQLLQSSNAQMGATIIGKTISSAIDQTTGVVKSIQITSTGTSAILDSGASVNLASGFTLLN